MIRPCDIILTGCPGVDSPITNLSAEAPDPFLWAGVGYDIYNPYQPPPLGDGLYTDTDCYGVAWSATSQAEADLLANQYVILCTQGVPFPPLPPLVLDPGGAGFPTFPGLPFGISVDAARLRAPAAARFSGIRQHRPNRDGEFPEWRGIHLHRSRRAAPKRPDQSRAGAGDGRVTERLRSGFRFGQRVGIARLH